MFYKNEEKCRACDSTDLGMIQSFGETPLADRLLTKTTLNKPELAAPLTLVLCKNCNLVQIRETVDPEVLFFAEYPYFSSVSPSLLKHFGSSAKNIIERKNLDCDSLVVEAASNDGYMLKNFYEKNIPVLGIDPAKEPARVAQESGISTLCTFFSKTLAENLVEEGNTADVFLANNVLAHVPDINGFVRGVSTILKNTGLAVIEVPYFLDLIAHCEFDTIYHQHLCYFSVTALDNLFRKHKLYLNDVVRTSIHGGSLRLFIEPFENRQSSVLDLLEMESKKGMDDLKFYQQFAEDIQKLKSDLSLLLGDLKAQGKRIAGYGAAAKATTLLSFCNIDDTYLDYIVDLNPYKHGKFMGGNKIPIYHPKKILDDKPDFLLILAWNFAEEIMKQQQEYASKGGQFVIPIPDPHII